MRTILILFLLTTSGGLFLAGCGDPDRGSSSASEVVATTAIVADLVGNVHGGEVTELLPSNADPHHFEPSPGDAEELLGAKLIVRSGGDLDAWIGELVEGSGADAPVLDLLDAATAADGPGAGYGDGGRPADGKASPHWWQNPLNAIAAVQAIRDRLIAIFPGRAAAFERNAASYTAGLRALDASIERCVQRLPPQDRELVSGHDALGPYADRYGLRVLGAVIPALSTRAQASAGATAELVELIREHRVAAIFPEAGVNADLERAIADEAGAAVGPRLWIDTLGPVGSGAETYIGAMATNTLSIVGALSRRQVRCPDLDTVVTEAS